MPRPTRLAAQKGAGSVPGLFSTCWGSSWLGWPQEEPHPLTRIRRPEGEGTPQGGDALPAGTATDPQAHTGCSSRLGPPCRQGVQLSWAARIYPRFHLEAQGNELLVTPSLRCGVRPARGLFSF